MSEKNNPGLIITTEAEVMPGLSFDFEFITQTLNLIPIQGGSAAINLASIAEIVHDAESNGWVIGMENDSDHTLTNEDMAELEQTLKRRIEDNKIRAKQAMLENARMQIEVGAEIQGGVQPGKIVGVAPTGRRVRH